MNCHFGGAISRTGGAQKRADGVAGAKYSHILDDWNTCIVVAGKNQETKVISFFFQP